MDGFLSPSPSPSPSLSLSLFLSLYVAGSPEASISLITEWPYVNGCLCIDRTKETQALRRC